MTLDFDTCYRALLARDPRFDGRFYTAVTSTGIYCRPVCPARTPARANLRFFAHPGAAEAAGFRACRRCRPETSPGSPEWNARADLAARAVRLISAGYVDEHGIGGLAARLAVTPRHLHRLLLAELGTGPLALARTARLQTARRLLAETQLPITDVAFASGFSSVRQFNAAVLESGGRTPSQLRAAARRTAPPGGPPPAATTAPPPGTATTAPPPAGGPVPWLTLRLACREPYDAAGLLRFLAARAVPGVEQVSPDRYAAAVRTGDGAALVELLPRPGQGHVLLRARLSRLSGIGPLVAGGRRLLDADADPAAISAVLAADELLAPLVRARPGLRVPGCFDGFELAVRAVLGQQVSVAAARTLAGRLAARHGTPLPASLAADGPPGLSRLFPGPGQLAGADLTGLGLTAARQRTLHALAEAAATGRLDLGPGADPDEAAARLAELPGIGPWTVSYIRLRTGADPDAFPASDLAVRRALARLGAAGGHDARWRPWRGYATLHLWTWLAAAAPADAAPGSAAPAPPGSGSAGPGGAVPGSAAPGGDRA